MFDLRWPFWPLGPQLPTMVIPTSAHATSHGHTAMAQKPGVWSRISPPIYRAPAKIRKTVFNADLNTDSSTVLVLISL